MGDTQAGDKGGANAGASPRSKGDLVVIREQVLENGDLLRQNTTLLHRLIELVLPKADADGQPLHELLSLLVAQQRQTHLLVQELSTGMDALMDHVLGEDPPTLNGNGAAEEDAQA